MVLPSLWTDPFIVLNCSSMSLVKLSFWGLPNAGIATWESCAYVRWLIWLPRRDLNSQKSWSSENVCEALYSWANWGRRTHTKCGQYHSIGWGPDWMRRGEGAEHGHWYFSASRLCFRAPSCLELLQPWLPTLVDWTLEVDAKINLLPLSYFCLVFHCSN